MLQTKLINFINENELFKRVLHLGTKVVIDI